MILVRRVVGDSMLPTLKPGRVVIAVRWRLGDGRVVVVDVGGREVVKRIKFVDENGVILEGDNMAASADSREYGPVPKSAILGVVIWPRTTPPIRP